VAEDVIPLVLPSDGEMEYCERPLRAQTAQGERVALARSEMLPAGTRFSCGLVLYPGEITEEILRQLLDYMFDMGIGQWRNAGYGGITYKLTREE